MKLPISVSDIVCRRLTLFDFMFERNAHSLGLIILWDPFWKSSRFTCTLNSMRHLKGENFKALFLRARLEGNHEVFKK